MKIKRTRKLIALAIVLLSLPVVVYLALNRQTFFGQASPSTVPQDVKISNISDNSFSVSWVTPDRASVGYLSWGENQLLENTASDDRGVLGNERFTHHMTVKNLKPGTSYYFRLGSDSDLYGIGDDAAPFQIDTAPITQDPPFVAEPVFGKILREDESPAGDVLVYLQVEGGSLLSSYTDKTGNWLVTLNNARTPNFSSYVVPKPGDPITIIAQGASQGVFEVDTKVPPKKVAISTIKLGSGFVPQSLETELKSVSSKCSAQFFLLDWFCKVFAR